MVKDYAYELVCSDGKGGRGSPLKQFIIINNYSHK